ncbi:hypothetical protein D3C78_1871100 [compost metagenome]
MVDRIAATAADADDLDYRVRLNVIDHFKHFPSPFPFLPKQLPSRAAVCQKLPCTQRLKRTNTGGLLSSLLLPGPT